MRKYDRFSIAALLIVFSLATQAAPANAQAPGKAPNASDPGQAQPAPYPGALAAGIASANGKWTFHTIGVPFSGHLIGMNDNGTALAAAGNSAFVFRNGDKIISLLKQPVTGEEIMAPVAINNHDQVLMGRNEFAEGYYIYDPVQKAYSPVSWFAQIKGASGEDATSIVGGLRLTGFNDMGQFTGTSTVRGREIAIYGTLFVGPPGTNLAQTSGQGSLTTFACPGGAQTQPTGINNHGQIVGTCKATQPGQPALTGFHYNAATATMTLFTVPGAIITQPTAINDAGLIAGGYQASIRVPVSSGFIYDGSQFTQFAAPPAAGTRTPGNSYIPMGLNNHGDIVGRAVRNASFVATVGDGKLSQLVDLLSFTPAQKRSYPHSTKPAAIVRDPNLPTGYGERTAIGWNFAVNTGSTVPSIYLLIGSGNRDMNSENYLGFDDAYGTLFEDPDDRYIYAYSGKTTVVSWIGKGIYDLPVDVITGLKNPSKRIREMLGENQLTSAQAANPALQTAHGENGVISTGADGQSTLTYVLFAPGAPTDGNHMSFPVVRPVVTSVSMMPTLVVPSSGNTGNWLWNGDAEHPGVAAVFALDSGGIVSWTFITPQISDMYMGKSSPVAAAPAGTAPPSAPVPGAAVDIVGTGASIQGGVLTFTLANHSKATYKVVRPKAMQNSQGAAAGITGVWIAVEDGGNGILFTVLADNSVSGKEVPAALVRALM